MKQKINLKLCMICFIIVLICSFIVVGFSVVLTGLDSFTGSFTVSYEPRLIKPIPNQTWDMNTNHIGPDLDDYFIDGNGDILSYTASSGDNPNINITIYSNSTVYFTQPEDWIGVEYVVFTATDNISNASSNNVTLTVNFINTPPAILNYSYESLGEIPLLNITEEENISFNISFTDNESANLTITWRLDSEIKSQTEVKLGSGNNSVNSSEYTFFANYSSAGIKNVFADVFDGEFTITQQWILNITNVNRPPYFNKTILNISWNQGSTYTIDSLDNYVADPDLAIDDILNYSYIFINPSDQINVMIDNITHEVTFDPDITFSGSKVLYFNVTDIAGEFNYSNNMTLTVIPVIRAQPSGKSGGGSSTDCENYYSCNSWTKCSPITHTRTRECVDLAECKRQLDPPKEFEECTYISTCDDGIKNQDEEGIDCGGSCASCFTCYDGVQNQDEEGIDCGGPCDFCATCNDGIKNCIKIDKDTILCEEDIDCGGQCSPCDTEVVVEVLAPPGLFERIKPYLIISSVIISVIISLVILFLAVNKLMVLIKRKTPILQGIKIKDLLALDTEICGIEKRLSSMPNHRVLKNLHDILVKVIKNKFNIIGPYTQNELVSKLSNIKGDKIVKDLLSHSFARLYRMKYSADNEGTEKLHEYTAQAKIINRLEIIDLYGKHEKKEIGFNLKKIYNLNLKRFYYLNRNSANKVNSIANLIQIKEKALPEEERKLFYKSWKLKYLDALKITDVKISKKIIKTHKPIKEKQAKNSNKKFDIEKEFKSLLKKTRDDINSKSLANAKNNYNRLSEIYNNIRESQISYLKKQFYYEKVNEIHKHLLNLVKGLKL